IRLQPGTPADFEETINETIARITKRRDFVIENLEASRIRQSRITWIPLIAGLSICGFLILNIALGLFGVLFYSISKRRAEIGLRRALGATRHEITRQFTLEIFAVALLGMLLAAILAVQFPLLEVIPLEADNFYWSILLTTVLISVLVLLCAFWPSRQAARVHPAKALHEE
ncbi:MAG: FtsX-like permease family protein, partial [Lewinella sp.]|nr:FtsX-like permease family protein [Lewinella sp.]